MAKDPAFLFYSNDFLTGTYTMTDEQVGKFIRLLCLQHQKGSLHEKDMMHICKAYDEDIFSKFTKTGDVFVNERLKEEAEKRLAYSESRRKNKLKSRVSIINEKQIDLTGATYVVTHDTSYVEHMENENENVNEDEIINKVFANSQNANELSVAWDNWKQYKKDHFKFKYKTKQSEIAALKNLKTLSDGKIEQAIAIIAQSIANGWKGLFTIKGGSTAPVNEKRFAARMEYANRHN